MSPNQPPALPTVLYVAGPGHTGSTYLSRVLNQHPAIFCGGEMVYLHFRLAEGWGCSCQAEGRECGFWRDIIGALDQQGRPVEETTRLTRARNREWLAALFLPRSSQRKQRFMANNRAYFRAVAEASGKPIVLDCSKTPWRLLPLWRDPALRVKVLHLVRNPRGHIASRMKNGDGFWRSAIMRYWRKNQLFRSFFGGSDDYFCLSFDRFLEQPETVLAELFQWLEVPPVNPFSMPPATYHHLCGGWARQDRALAPPRPDLSRESRRFSRPQEAFVRLLERHFFPRMDSSDDASR